MRATTRRPASSSSDGTRSEILTRTIGIDIGGTFTDFVSYNSTTGVIENWKNLTTPAEPIEGFSRV
jgi:hypothetical protein